LAFEVQLDDLPELGVEDGWAPEVELREAVGFG
jgi:hypothetical protein